MKLRSGFSYSFENVFKTPVQPIKTKPPCIQELVKKKIIKKRVKPIITIDKNLSCSICNKLFVKDDLICSCSINKINKHAFHKNCLTEWLKHCHPVKKCPYCLTDIKKRLVYVKIQ